MGEIAVVSSVSSARVNRGLNAMSIVYDYPSIAARMADPNQVKSAAKAVPFQAAPSEVNEYAKLSVVALAEIKRLTYMNIPIKTVDELLPLMDR